MLIGGGAARDPVEGEGAAKIPDAMRAMSLTSELSGDDVLLTARLRAW
jgi:riboflavin biosynthesis pyrimidine reductase